MIEDQIRARLAALPATFALVEGAAELSLVAGQPKAFPAAYVFESEKAAAPNERLNAVLQRIEADYAIVLVAKSVAAASGAAALTQLRPLETAVLAALIGWQPTGADQPITFTSSTITRVAAGTVWLEVVVSTSWYLEGTAT